jgi:hypothetical protein
LEIAKIAGIARIEKGLFRFIVHPSSFILHRSSFIVHPDPGKNKSGFLAALGMTTLYRGQIALKITARLEGAN